MESRGVMDAGSFLGVDIGKSGHYAVAVDAAGKPIYQTAVANEESALRELVAWATEQQASVVVDQPGGAAGVAAEAVLASGRPHRLPARPGDGARPRVLCR